MPNEDQRNNQKDAQDIVNNDTAQTSPQASDCDCEKCNEYLNGWKRAQADYANLKKDTDQARAEFAKYANENLLHEILPAIDHFETALQHVPDLSNLPDDERKKLESWLAGIKAVKQFWEQTFQSIGLERVNTEGVFDPSKHTAVGKEELKTLPEHAIIREVQSGWSLHGKILRPAKVIVNQLSEP